LERSILAARVASESKPAFASEMSDLLSKTATRLEKVAKISSDQ
jgi:hypothetical protein